MKKQYILAGLLCFTLMPFGKTYAMFPSPEEISHIQQLDKRSGTWKESLMQFDLAHYFISMDDVSDDVKQFVHNELKRIGLKNYENIKVKCNHTKGFSPLAATHGAIIIRPGIAYTIEVFLKKFQQLNSLTTKEQKEVVDALNGFRGIIQHEGGHLKHQHQLKSIMMGLAINGPLCFLLRSYQKEHYTLVFLCSLVSIFIQGYFIVPWYSRICEQQADDTVVDDEALLEQMVKHHYSPMDEKKQYSDTFDTHPADWKRAERYQARLDALRNKRIKKDT